MARTAQEKLDAKREKEYNKKHKRKYKLSTGDIVFNILNYAFFTLFTITCIFPFYYLFINTISDNSYVTKGMINFYPRGLNIQNYLALREVHDLSNAFIVSISRTIIGTVLMVLASAFVGYLMTKQESENKIATFTGGRAAETQKEIDRKVVAIVREQHEKDLTMILNILGLVLGILLVFRPYAAMLSADVFIGGYLVLLGLDSIVMTLSKAGKSE